MIVLLAIQLFFALTGAQLDRIKVDAEEHWFYDTQGRVVLFHGVNSVRKEFPWYFENLFNDTLLDDLSSFGLNIVRLGSMWTGAEPVEGMFNETYIDILEDIVGRLADRGMYTLLDMHQDVLSSYYGSYDGVPPWLIDYFPPPTNPYPWPLEEIIYWEQGYLTQACSEGFQCLYNNTEGAVEKWANFWVKMAETFKDNPNVLGYEYMNEPWVGDYFEDSNLALPGYAARQNLVPAYDHITEQVRATDPDQGIVFYEPVIYGQLLEGDFTGAGFDEVPGGSQYANLSTYSWHAYCWALEFVGSNATDDERQDAIDYCNDTLLPTMFESAQAQVNKTGGVSLLTEFGICVGYDPIDRVDISCDLFVQLADEYLSGWIEWDFNDGAWYTDGNRNMGRIMPLVRPYARRTAGIPKNMYFDLDTLEFTLEFEANLDITSPTEVFLPPDRYAEGVETAVSEGFEVIPGDYLQGVYYISPTPENVDITSAVFTAKPVAYHWK